MANQNDVRFILRMYGKDLIRHPKDIILHVDCATGRDTQEIFNFFPGLNSITGVDVSNDLLIEAQHLDTSNDIDYKTLDITSDQQVDGFRHDFTKIFFFSCFSWNKNVVKALENTRLLMADGGECFFSFVGKSPVYDTYENMAETSQWGTYMEDYRSYIPFTHTANNPAATFLTLLTNAGFLVKKCECASLVAFTVDAIQEHIREVNYFVKRVPGGQRLQFINACADALQFLNPNSIPRYKLVIAHVRLNMNIQRSLQEVEALQNGAHGAFSKKQSSNSKKGSTKKTTTSNKAGGGTKKKGCASTKKRDDDISTEMSSSSNEEQGLLGYSINHDDCLNDILRLVNAHAGTFRSESTACFEQLVLILKECAPNMLDELAHNRNVSPAKSDSAENEPVQWAPGSPRQLWTPDLSQQLWIPASPESVKVPEPSRDLSNEIASYSTQSILQFLLSGSSEIISSLPESKGRQMKSGEKQSTTHYFEDDTDDLYGPG